jgi:DNA-binding response OmpR family regulator
MRKILVIDDDPGILEVLTLILEDADYEVETIMKVDKDINKRLKSFHPDLILLDMLLSGLDGRDIARKLKANPKYVQIPIIMLSAHPNAKKEALTAGANYFMAKPFDIYELTALVKKSLH